MTSRAPRMATGETGIGWGNGGVKPVVPDMKALGFFMDVFGMVNLSMCIHVHFPFLEYIGV